MPDALTPLGDPAEREYSKRYSSGECHGSWETWSVESHLGRLYARCDELLVENQRLAERVESLERLLGLRGDLNQRIERFLEENVK